DPELFWATAGGMGLTGLIVRAVIQLKRVSTSRIRVDTVRTADIDETMAVLAEHDTSYGYTVAWSDSLARGAPLGRAPVTTGRGTPFVRTGQPGPRRLLRDRAQAVRRGRPRAALVPGARLDARARRARPHRGARGPADLARPAGRRRGRPGLPGQGLARAGRH